MGDLCDSYDFPANDFDFVGAVRRANKAAAKAVEQRGAQSSIPWMDQVRW